MKSTVTETKNNIGIKHKVLNFDFKRLGVIEYLVI